MVTEDTKWPPTPTVCYINVAYISKSDITRHESKEFASAAVLGKIEDIVRVKAPLSFKEVACKLPNGSLPRIVLVEGAPGVGKTTFVWEACQRWGNGEILKQYSLVVVLRLRDKRVREASVLSDLFYHSNKALLQSVVQEIENNLGENLLLILEGLDELPEELREQPSIFLDLMHGRLLPKATILVTTRPCASQYLHEHCSRRIDQHIEILGFTKEQVDCYLESVLGGDSETLADINEYLARYPQIHAAMRIPLNAAIVVCVYNESRTGKCILPQTMTELYTALAQTLLLRYVREHPTQGENEQLHSFTDLRVPPDVSKSFHKLTKVAYDGIVNSQQLIFSDLPRDFETLGFMQSVPELYISKGVHVSHTFLHLTIQEYLAAVHISQLPPDEQLKHFDEYGDTFNSDSFRVVITFVAGLTKFSRISSDSARALFGKSKYIDEGTCVKCNYTVFSAHVRWMFETQDSSTINAILGSGNTIKFPSAGCKPFDYYCLGYCIAHSHCQWKLVFYDDIREEDIKMLTVGGSTLIFSKQHSSIVSVRFSCRRSVITPEVLACLFETLPLHIHFELQELIGYKCELEVLTAIITPRVVQCLKVLQWKSTDISVKNFREVCGLLTSTSSDSLEIIKLSSSHVLCGPHVSIEGAQHSSVSMDVRVSCVEDVTSTVYTLRENYSLRLHLTAISLLNFCGSIDETCQIAEALHDTASLRQLNFSGNPIGTKGALTLAKVIHDNKSLEDIRVCTCKIDSDGACHLTQAMHGNTTVRKLDLSNNPIGHKGAFGLAEMLHTNTSLHRVDLYNCELLGDEGTHKLIEAMTVNSTLHTLRLPREYEDYAKLVPGFSEVTTRVTFFHSVHDKYSY